MDTTLAPVVQSEVVMDVKDVPVVKSGSVSTPKQISGKSLVSVTASKVSSDQVSVNSNQSRESQILVSKTNEAISTTNIATDATKDIEQLVKSIGGIVKLAADEATAPQRKTALEKEANTLVDEIKKRAAVEGPNGTKPLAGDPIRLEIEESLGKRLEVLLPDDAKEAFGIGKVSFSTKEVILNTVVAVKSAEERILKLREALNKTAEALKGTVDEVDIANQNAEAAKSSVRDVDQALRLAFNTRDVISGNPSSAMSSLGKLTADSLRVLENE